MSKKYIFIVTLFLIMLNYIYILEHALTLVLQPKKEELIGKYRSHYRTYKFEFYLDSNGSCKIIIYNKKKLINEYKMEHWDIEKDKLGYNLNCYGKHYIISTEISRNIYNLKIKILNIGTEDVMIDPDLGIYYKKVL